MNSAILCIIIFAICVVLYVTSIIPNAVTSVLGCMALIITGACSTETALSGISNDVILLVFGMVIIGEAMFHVGLAHAIGRSIVRISRDNERMFLFSAMVVAACMSAFLSNTTVIAMFMAICKSVSSISKRMQLKNLMMPIAIASMFGGSCTLIGSTPQLMAQSLMPEDSQFSMFEFVKIGGPLTIIAILLITFVCYPLGKKIWGDRYLEGIGEIVESTDTTGENKNNRKMAVMTVIFVLVILGFVFEWAAPGVVATIGGMICIVTGCLPFEKALRKSEWGMMLWLAGTFGLAGGLKESGASALIGSGVGKVISGMSPFMVFAAICLISLVASNFMANTTTVAVFLPIILAVTPVLGLNPNCFAMGIIMGASLTFATPIANGQIGLSMVGGYKFSDYFKYAGLLTLITYIGMVILIPIFYPIVL